MPEPQRHTRRDCWCGNQNLKPFCAAYRLCEACGTIVSQVGLANDGYLVNNDETDFYGKQYWLDHQAQELGLPPIRERARLDLPERCLYWLRNLLSYRRPSAKVLELGAAHGGFVALMRWAGFDATGLEMSAWVADLARQTFDVPMLVGPIEQQNFQQGSFDVVVANDVMEHLPDPVTTLRRAVDLLKPDGLLIIQMPEYPDGKSHTDLQTDKARFLEHTREPNEHLYLYSQRSVRKFLARLGLNHVEFLPPFFDYDMYFIASKQPLQHADPAAVDAFLQTAPLRRLLLALFDQTAAQQRTEALWRIAEEDRAARLAVINRQSCQLTEMEASWQRQVQQLHELLAVSDTDRAARLDAMNELERQIVALDHQLAACEADRSARLAMIQELSRTLKAADDDRAARLRVIVQQEKAIRDQQQTIAGQQQALKFLQAGLFEYRPPMWKRLAKTVVKKLLPSGLRQSLRARLARASL
jgi:2-polyprenyl-3-methyl-5-hydroxy-6-metoxy-1,4-benzoquinol methylase